MGEILTPSGACHKCDVNEYSIEAGADKCEDCPEEAVCKGGHDMFPKKEYWRNGWESDKFY